VLESPGFYDNIGGRGFGVFELLEKTSPSTEALSAENLLVFAAGNLTGTAFPGSSRVALVTKNALNGGISTSSGGGNFGPGLRRAGFDALVVSGKASSPCWILLKDGSAEIQDGASLWGCSVWETVDRIRKTAGDADAEVASIGISGERLVKIACVMIDRAHALAWGGSGAVMGFKNLKAVAVSGKAPVAPCDPDGFRLEANRYSWILKSSAASAALRSGGTHGMAGVGGWSGKVPTSVRNLQEEFWEAEKSFRINEAAFRPFEKKRTACWNCPLSCLHFYEMEKDGKSLAAEGMHANSVRGLGSNLDIDDPFAVLEAHALCNSLGLDVDGVSAAVAWAVECFERGILASEDTGGLQLRWGNSGDILSLIRMIAERKGFGAVLAEGVLAAAGTVGRGSERYAMHVKGIGLNEQGVRSHKAWGFGMAVSARGGGHLNGSPQTENRQVPSWTGEWLFGNDEAGIPGSYKGKAKLVAWYEIYKAIVDSTGICYFAAGWYDPALADLSPLSKAIEALTGSAVSAEDLWKKGRRIVEAEKLFNTLHAGFGRKDDTLPRRVMEEPLSFGPYSDAVMNPEHFERMLDEYYEERGWDAVTGLQTPESLRKAGAGDLLKYLPEAGNRRG
jgi:aldehyde:ferredoxin oxidoreductase